MVVGEKVQKSGRGCAYVIPFWKMFVAGMRYEDELLTRTLDRFPRLCFK